VTVSELDERIGREVSAGWDVTLAFDQGALAGFLALIPAAGCLDQLFIAPAAQMRGIGAMLLDHAKRSLPDGLWLRAAASNTGALRFYARHGLREAERAPHPRHGHLTVILRWP
jgi:ribosomal protein S18 acetylase RimI-like enzyme